MIEGMNAPAPKTGKITAENTAEAARLRGIWESKAEWRAQQGYSSQEAFGEKFNIGNQAAVGFFLNGKTALSLKAAIGFAKGLQCSVSDFSPRLAELSNETGAAGWPFLGIDPKRFFDLLPDQRLEIQGVVRERIERFESENRPKAGQHSADFDKHSRVVANRKSRGTK